MLTKLARVCYRRRWRVLAAWLVAFFGFIALGSTVGADLTTNFELPGADSDKAFEIIDERFQQQGGDSARLVFKADQGVNDPSVRAPMTKLIDDLRALDIIASVQSPYDPGLPTISRDGKVAFASMAFDVSGTDLTSGDVRPIRDTVEAVEIDGVQIELGGAAVSFTEQGGPGSQEFIGILAAIFILLITFGSVIAMGLPIMTAIFGLGIGTGLIMLFGHFVDIPEFAPQLASMIGLGVGVDYALFIVTRFRAALHAGVEPEDAVVLAINTAGRAVLFAGVTVVISLLGLFVIGLSFVQGLAIGASTTVLVVMLASVTLLPAVLGFSGHAIDKLHVPFLHRDESEHRATFWFRWSRIVQRRPLPAALAGTLVLVVVALPIFSIRLGFSDDGNLPETSSARRAYDLLADGFGPGFNGPLLLAADIDSAEDRAAMNGLTAELATVPGVAFVAPPNFNPANDAAVMLLVPSSSPQDEATKDLVERLHDKLENSNPQVYVGGITAIFVDMSGFLESRLPFFIGGVVVLSFLLLMVVFRSLLIPLKAALVNLLGIGAAYGSIVAIFQWGWLSDVVGIDRTGPIEPFLPMMLFAILFGLSMDYEVFLMSRIREEYLHTKRNDLAVADGLAATARVITAAAAIMVTLFLSFVVFGGDRVIKLFGFGLAFAIFLDATLIRMVVVPSLMELFGDANWWLPKWLDRIIPNVSVEAPPQVTPMPKAAAPRASTRKPAVRKAAPKPVARRKPASRKPAASKKPAARKKPVAKRKPAKR